MKIKAGYKIGKTIDKSIFFIYNNIIKFKIASGKNIAKFIRYSFKEYFFFANAEFIKYIAYEQASEFVNIDTTNKIISNNFSMINSPFN